MKKLIMLLSLVAMVGIANAAALSSVTPNVVSVTPYLTVTMTGSYGSAWVVVPAQSAYINQLNSATPNANYPTIVSASTYSMVMNRTGQIKLLGIVTGNVTFVPAAAYLSVR